MNRRRAWLVLAVAGASLAAYLGARGPESGADSANGGGPGDGARDVTGSHPLPNETAAPKPSSGCSAAPARTALH